MNICFPSKDLIVTVSLSPHVCSCDDRSRHLHLLLPLTHTRCGNALIALASENVMIRAVQATAVRASEALGLKCQQESVSSAAASQSTVAASVALCQRHVHQS